MSGWTGGITALVVATTATSALLAPTAGAHAKPSGSCDPAQVGDSQSYTYSTGENVGTITQFYEPCSADGLADTVAKWTWNADFASNHPSAYVYFGFGSVGLDNGVPDFSSYANAGDSASSGQYAWYYARPHGDAKPDSWRAGAELDSSGCAAWTSQHYYATGAETAGPYAGCGDTGNVSQISWTRP